ncbi:MAG: hypothetical protein J5J00_15785 [Deltaproteobacteria bacterium]|nr:hypothetical protein [Deltaproteobacteria bacterium]
MKRLFITSLAVILSLTAQAHSARADALSDNPILFVTMVPNPADFATLAATFANHVATPNQAFRGGDLWIRYPDGSLKNLTSLAGFGNSGFQGAGAIAVRDPAVHWDGQKALFSMVVGAPTAQYQLTSHRWQLYEISGLVPSQTPVITKVANQPESYNNISPVYASDDSIIFVSDRPRDDTVLHTYPQRDEYESTAVVSGLWKLTTGGQLKLLDHAPSGDFNPIIDSYGRVIFTRWDHLQRDQQNIGASMGAFNYESETSTTPLQHAQEFFPEARSILDPDKQSNVNLFTINQFFPWMMNQDGTDLETLNHVGRQEIGLYSERSFNDDPNVQEFYGQYPTGQNQNDFTIFLHIKENPMQPGVYLGTSCQEFGTHSAGQIISISGAPGVNPDNMVVSYLTHPDTSGATDTPSANHNGLYRDPLPLSNGKILVSHTSNTRTDTNIGTSSSPLSRYDFRLKLLDQSGAYGAPGTLLTTGISKNVSFWNPDSMISYNGNLWEMMPVEVKSRVRPSAPTLTVPLIEQSVISASGATLGELQAYLKQNNLALVISRNVTMRDRNDRQQPTNLRITGTTTQSLPKSGKIYDVSLMQFFQGDLIRGYSSGNSTGRRVLAQPMHSVAAGLNPSSGSTINGAVQIAEDGSMAAFVPAGRALTWQMTDSDGTPVVRERYWVTFQPGEVRVCASCHGINTADHLGRSEPQNTPLALARLLAHWKNQPVVNPTYSLAVSAAKTKPRGKFTLTASGGSASDSLIIKAAINGKSCSGRHSLENGTTTRTTTGKYPAIKGATLSFSLNAAGSTSALASTESKLPGKRAKSKGPTLKQSCKKLIKSLKNR